MKFSPKWEVEDTFFGAILGAMLGILIDRLPIHYVTVIVFFFVIFPMTLRKAESISRYALTSAIVCNVLWIALLVYDLTPGYGHGAAAGFAVK
jgi:hypothetical protein